MAGGGMLTPPRGMGGQTDLIAQRRPQPEPAQLAGQLGMPGLGGTQGGIPSGGRIGGNMLGDPSMALGGTLPARGANLPGRVGGNMLGDPSMAAPLGQAGAAMGGRVGGNMLGDPSMAPAGLSPEVLAMIEAALGGQRPPMPAGGGMAPPAALPAQLRAAVPSAVARQTVAPAPLRPVPAPVATPPGMPTAQQLQDPRIAAAMTRVLGPIPGGFAGGASPELQRRWALHAQNLGQERGL
jgi:hypothetical protein